MKFGSKGGSERCPKLPLCPCETRLAKQCFPWAQVHYLMESVFSMDETDKAIMSEHMEGCPYMIDASGISICRRPRLYWISWEIQLSPGVSLIKHEKEKWTSYTVVHMDHQVQEADFIKAGWRLAGEATYVHYCPAEISTRKSSSRAVAMSRFGGVAMAK